MIKLEDQDKCKPNDNGDCQHITIEDHLRIIPSGIHIIGGRTVSATGSSNTPATNHQSGEVKQEADNLANDLLQILDKNGVAQVLDKETLKNLLVDLSIYHVNRDHRILNHGIEVGRINEAGRLKS